MKIKLLAASVLLGAVTVLSPIAGLSQERDKDTPKSFVKETVMTTKIKAAMAKDKQVSAMHIKVESDSTGVVHLSGKAKSQAEADKAVEIARNTEGVKDVRSTIEVVSDR